MVLGFLRNDLTKRARFNDLLVQDIFNDVKHEMRSLDKQEPFFEIRHLFH